MAARTTHSSVAGYESTAARTGPRADWKGACLGGLVAGLVAGVAMAMVAMIRAGVTGMGFWLPPKQIAATLFGVDALIGGAGVIVTGLMIHMMTSAIFGVVFGLIGGGRIFAWAAMALGFLYGVIIWAGMTFIGLPVVNEVMRDRVAMQPVWWFGYHLIFGGMLFLTPLLAKAFSSERQTAKA